MKYDPAAHLSPVWYMKRLERAYQPPLTGIVYWFHEQLMRVVDAMLPEVAP